MSTALSILTSHRYAITHDRCVNLRGEATSCTWKPRRGKHANGPARQHDEHLAALIDAAYAVDLEHHARLQSVEDLLHDLQLVPPPDTEFGRGVRHVLAELAAVLEEGA